MLVLAYYRTYGLPVTISRCSNNYGTYHFPEKLIPLMIANALNDKPLPVYGKGINVRDWLYVEDHCKTIDLIIHNGKVGEVYNVGGHNEMKINNALDGMEKIEQFCDKGGSVVLTYTDDVFPVDSKVYNNVFHKPVVSGYVDMLAVSGNDGLAEQKAPAYEGKAPAEQSKKKAIRRKCSILDDRIVIADTDNSDCISGDCVIVDYSFGNQDYIAWALPASSADGESVSSMIIPQYMVTYDNRYSDQNVERFYDYGTRPEDLTMQRENYIFEGWYSDLECTEKYDFTVKPTQDVVLYAKWTKESEPTLPVTPTAIPTEKVTEAPTPTEGSRVTPTPTAVPTVKATVVPTKAAVPSKVKTAPLVRYRQKSKSAKPRFPRLLLSIILERH